MKTLIILNTKGMETDERKRKLFDTVLELIKSNPDFKLLTSHEGHLLGFPMLDLEIDFRAWEFELWKNEVNEQSE